MNPHTQTLAQDQQATFAQKGHICTTKADRAWHQALSLDQTGCLITRTFWRGFWPVSTSSAPGVASALIKDVHLFQISGGNPI